MTRKKFLVFSSALAATLFSCGFSQGPTTKGAKVYVYKPQQGNIQLVCKDNQKLNSLGVLYIGDKCGVGTQAKDCVKGKVSESDKKLIIQSARAYISQTGYIVPVYDTENAEVPYLSIDVNKFSVETERDSDRVKEKGIFVGYMSIYKPVVKSDGTIDLVECSTTQPVVEKITYQEPIYKEDKLPAPEQLKVQLIKRAVGDVINQFVPMKYAILRPVKSQTEYSKKLATLVDGGNYRKAIQEGEKILSNEKAKKDAYVYYNIGVAYEALASNAEGNLDKQIQLLKKAQEYYSKALDLAPDDKDINRALRDVNTDLQILEEIAKAQQSYKAKTATAQTTEGGF